MTTQSKPGSDNAIQALRPVDISGFVEPVEGEELYDGGVGINAFERGLRINISPWQMKLGDECRLYWQNVASPIRLEVIDTDDKLNKEVVFNLTSQEVLDGSAVVFYTVAARHQTPEDSAKLKVLVKRTHPGGQLDQPEPAGHPNLRYRFVPDVANGIDQGMVDNGIRLLVLPYPNMTIYDKIVARWGVSETATFYPVTQRNIDDPLNCPIEVFFSKALIERAGQGIHAVNFQVIDRCGNFPHPFAPWAIATRVSVTLGDTAPLLPPEVTGEQAGSIDPAFLTELFVRVPKSGLHLNDLVSVDWQGRISRPTTPKRYTGGETLDFAIPLEWARESDQSKVTITYTVRGRTSQPKVVNVKTTIELKIPSVLEAYGEAGDRLKMADIYYARHATIQIPQFVGMAPGQTIRARWASSRHVFDSVITPVAHVGSMTFEVPRLEVVDAIGSTVNVSFTLRNYANGPLHRSEALRLAIDAQAFTLTPPRLTPDLSTVTIRFPGLLTGYSARVRLAGVVIRRTEWRPLTTGITAEFAIPGEWIEENKGKAVLINYSVNRPGIDEHSMFSQVLRVQL